ncbi:helix-turn-helix transcriptional regulator [Mycoplasmatota bacterium]|nr:helix-turn-helix transcriptional regulator [Mycoplasmatota bacterium]
MKINERLKHLRKSRNYTQRQIAKILGMTHSGYSKYERGERDPGLEVIVNLANIYGIPPGVIFVLGTSIDIDEQQNLNVLIQFYELRKYEIEQLILRFQSRIMEEQEGFAYETQNDISEQVFEELKETLKILHDELEKIKSKMCSLLEPTTFDDLLDIPRKKYEQYVMWTEKIRTKKKERI